MKILLVYPNYPDTYWSFKHAMKFIARKAAFPPLGLLTVAAMLPKEWEKKLVDMNVTRLTDSLLKWADYVFISAMEVQKESAVTVIQRCKKLGVKTVAGGPLFTASFKEFDDIDYLVLGEAEASLAPFLNDLENGRARRIYNHEERPPVEKAPVPLWSLINMKHYSSMNLQYSRGCPFDCEFCDIVLLNGHNPRTKSKAQFITEMDSLYEQGWRGSLFIVDDNFIGNKRKLKEEILPALIEWQKAKRSPFSLCTEASINLADDEELINMMVAAGFEIVFIGIETPNEKSLVECTKAQNQNRDLVAAVKKLQSAGLEVQGGFIVGFDNDPDSIFQNQIEFIQKSGIVAAMVGLLNAPAGTRLAKRLQKEGRLLGSSTGNNTDFSLNFVPKMDAGKLTADYKHILNTIYSPKQYYERVRTFLKVYRPPRTRFGRLERYHIQAFLSSIWFLGINGKGKIDYWKLFWTYLWLSRSKFVRFITFTVYGYHFQKVLVTRK